MRVSEQVHPIADLTPRWVGGALLLGLGGWVGRRSWDSVGGRGVAPGTRWVGGASLLGLGGWAGRRSWCC